MAQVNLASVFELVNYLAHDAATPVCGHGCVEVNRAVRTVRAGKRTLYGTFERLGAGLAKWRHDPNKLSFAFIAEILAGSDVFSANGTCGRIEQ
jgi:hypothetical protein